MSGNEPGLEDSGAMWLPLTLAPGAMSLVRPIDPLVITDDDDELLFAIRRDGTVELPDPDRAGEAAAIFWREVMRMAEVAGYPVRKIPQSFTERTTMTGADGITVTPPDYRDVYAPDRMDVYGEYGPTSDDPRTHIPEES